jgi:aspartokinase-like uncharacterized kinase
VIVETCERRKLAPLVVKIGGSLLAGSRLAGVVATLARARRPLVIVPGGGPFADAVRTAQQRHETSDRAAHAMALLAMHQMGLMLEDMQPRLTAVETLASIRQALAVNRIPVWLPLRLAETDETMPADWSVTSDALAARLAERLRFEGVLLVKSRCVPRGPTAEELAAEGIVDPVFGEIVQRAGLAFRIVGPGEERDLASICHATLTMSQSKVRRLPGRPERIRRGARRVAGGFHLAPRP